MTGIMNLEISETFGNALDVSVQLFEAPKFLARIYAKKWAAKNRDKIRATKRAQYKKNPKKHIARIRAWQLANPDKLKKYQRTSRLRKIAKNAEAARAMSVETGETALNLSGLAPGRLRPL